MSFTVTADTVATRTLRRGPLSSLAQVRTPPGRIEGTGCTVEIETIALNAAYAAYVSASLVPGGLRLRIALVLQSLVFITWGVVAGNPTAIIWNVIFATVNLWQAIRLFRHDKVELTPVEESVRLELFQSLSRRDFLVLWSAGQSGEAKPGQRLCSVGDQLDELLLLLDGTIDVRTASGLDVERSVNSFVGEMSYLSNMTASADVSARTSLQFRRWSFDDLRRLQRLYIDVGLALEQAIGRDVANKLRT